ncbi:hypothetical protein XENORESO_003665 [Xenotaenia resolanae]|uniref:Uncharacterized protein n=1 Tax=Xenotaenia resolanae TaxID=208358 RepID=A0ABV0W106_9TELE
MSRIISQLNKTGTFSHSVQISRSRRFHEFCTGFKSGGEGAISSITITTLELKLSTRPSIQQAPHLALHSRWTLSPSPPSQMFFCWSFSSNLRLRASLYLLSSTFRSYYFP